MWLALAGVVNRVMEAGRPLLKTKGVAREFREREEDATSFSNRKGVARELVRGKRTVF